jgi:hypothetical protein
MKPTTEKSRTGSTRPIARNSLLVARDLFLTQVKICKRHALVFPTPSEKATTSQLEVSNRELE